MYTYTKNFEMNYSNFPENPWGPGCVYSGDIKNGLRTKSDIQF
jgi:hypothetical protein